MEIVVVAFEFAEGQFVRWRQPQGTRYRIRQCRYVRGEGLERHQYLLTTRAAPGFDFWADEHCLWPDTTDDAL